VYKPCHLSRNGVPGESGDGGSATAAEIFPYGIALDGAANLYIANLHDEVRMVPSGGGVITTVAGSGYTGFGGDGGSATTAEFCNPLGLAFDKSGNLYIADECNYRVRKVTFSGAAATPDFSLAPGTYHGPQTVSITDETPEAVIYYTTDGSTPTAGSSPYTGPVSVSSSETLQAIAAATGYTTSAVASAAYQISSQPVAPAITWETPAPISYGTGLSSLQLDATTTVAGSFVYSPAAGTVLGAGQYTLNTTFSPSDTTDYATSTASVSLTISQATPAAGPVGSSLNPALVSDPITFTAAVTSTAGTPTGTVTFLDGTTQLGTGTLTGGSATFTSAGLSAGSHTITASYSGDPNFQPVTSAPLTQVVESFSIAVSGSSSATVSPGGQASFALVATPPATGSPLTFTVTGLPGGANGTFSPATVAAGSTPTNVSLTVSVPGVLAMRRGESPFRRGTLPIVLGLILLPIAGRLRKASHRSLGLLWLWTLVLAGALSMSACGGGGGKPTPSSQTYMLTVTATSGSLTESTQLTLTVQ
jgi:hypothetical protein